MRRFYLKLDAAAEQRAHEKEFAKLAFATGETPRIIDQPPLIYHTSEDMRVLNSAPSGKRPWPTT